MCADCSNHPLGYISVGPTCHKDLDKVITRVTTACLYSAYRAVHAYLFMSASVAQCMACQREPVIVSRVHAPLVS